MVKTQAQRWCFGKRGAMSDRTGIEAQLAGLTDFAAEVGAWVDVRSSGPPDVNARALKFVEEAGELIQAINHRTGLHAAPGWRAKVARFVRGLLRRGRPVSIEDEMGDVMITLGALATVLGVDFGAVVAERWRVVAERIDIRWVESDG